MFHQGRRGPISAPWSGVAGDTSGPPAGQQERATDIVMPDKDILLSPMSVARRGEDGQRSTVVAVRASENSVLHPAIPNHGLGTMTPIEVNITIVKANGRSV